jgi:hypothetical protein
MGSPSARAGDHVFREECRWASIRGIAALISRLEFFPLVLPAVIIPGGFLDAFVLLFMLLI